MNSQQDQMKDIREPKEQGGKLSNKKIQNEAEGRDINVNNGARCSQILDKTNSLTNGLHLEPHSSQSSDQSKHKFSNSLSKNVVSGNLNSSVPKLSEPLPGCSTENGGGSTVEDFEFRNNVDYVTRIDKCPPKVSCSSDSSPEADRTNSYKTCGLNNIGANIGSTSHGTCCILKPNINSCGKDPGAGPSGLSRRARERRDSSSGNEGDLSDSEDYCIYTYKGNDDSVMAELVNQVQARENGEVEEHSGRSSPEMDFLEMDFDPGPSCEQDTGDSDLASINEDIQNIAMDNAEAEQVLLNDLSGGKVVSRQTNSQIPQNNPDSDRNVTNHQNDAQERNQKQSYLGGQVSKKGYSTACWQFGPSCSSQKSWEASSLHRHTATCPLRQSFGYHSTSGDLISPGDNRDTDPDLWADNSVISIPENSNLNSCKVNLSSNLYHRMMAKKLMLDKQAAFNQSSESNLENEMCDEKLDGLLPVEKVMLWTEQEAIAKQVTQIGTSACGTTAAINALYALEISFVLETLIKGVATRVREPGAPLPRYLVSRSLAGATHRDIARGISLATNGTVVTKFFSFYPERKVSLSHWLHYWISRGAAPIATLNLQHCGEGHDIPDAWHHQMIFGVSQTGIYLTNPLQCVPEQIIWHQLVSPSVLLIRQADVLAHWNSTTDLTPLMSLDYRWRKMNVLGQIVNVVRQVMHRDTTPGATHVRIPASYKAGITLVMHKNSPAASELLCAEQLPLL